MIAMKEIIHLCFLFDPRGKKKRKSWDPKESSNHQRSLSWAPHSVKNNRPEPEEMSLESLDMQYMIFVFIPAKQPNSASPL